MCECDQRHDTWKGVCGSQTVVFSCRMSRHEGPESSGAVLAVPLPHQQCHAGRVGAGGAGMRRETTGRGGGELRGDAARL